MTAAREDRRTNSVAELMVKAFAEQNVEFIFLNPGTDTAPVQEALLAVAAAGESVPRVILCPHETVAMAAAHGYFALTGRPQVVMVHVDVGTQNLGSMVHNAMRADAGVVVVAGKTPETSHGDEPGVRDQLVHWLQDVPDQAGVVRQYMKLTADLNRPSTVLEQVRRAFQVARSAPAGPVYLTVGRELLMERAPENTGSVSRYGPAAPASPDPNALREVARILAASRRPVVVTDRAGQRHEAVPALVELVERLGAVVVDRRDRVNFPSSHPAYLHETSDVRAALSGTDAVLVIESPVPWVPRHMQPPETATVITMGVDPIRPSMPNWSFPADIALACDPYLGIRALTAALDEFEVPRKPAAARTDPPDPGDRLGALHVAEALNQMLRDDDIVVEETTTNYELLRTRLRRDLSGTYFRSGGSGLGWPLGAALGVKLAAPGQRVVALVGDGSFLFSSPVAALWAFREYRTPVLVVVLRNGGYAASRRPVFELFPNGESAATGEVLGTLFGDWPDLAVLAQACQAKGEHVHEVGDLGPAIGRGLEALQDGVSTVLVAHVASPMIRRPG